MKKESTMKSRMNRLKGAGILMAAVVAAGSLQIPAMAQVEAAENNPVVETTITEADSFGASSSQGAQLNFSNIGATYNVKDYGASTSLDDNYPAFQAALDAANKYQKKHPGSQCKVVIPKGTYRIKGESSHGLIVYSNTWIYAEGATIKRRSDYNWHLMQTNMKGKGYNVTRNVKIEGGTWDGQGKETKNTNSVFRFAHASNMAFINCTVQNSFNAHIIELGGVKGFTAQGCTVKKYSQNDSSLKKEAIQLDICNNKTIMPGTATDDALCSDVLIENNTFTDLYRAVGSHSAVVGLYYDNVVIKNNVFSNIKGKAINTYNYTNCIISGNTFTNCCEAIDFRAMSMNKQYNGSFYAPANGSTPKAGGLKANLLISKNKITTDTASGHEAPDAAIRVFGAKVDSAYYANGKLAIPKGNYYVEGVRIENNTISGKANGISLGDVRGATLSNNTITGCKRSGVQIADGSKVTISGGKIQKNTRNGVLVEKNSEAYFRGGRIEKNSVNGINVTKSKISVSNKCIIAQNKSHGISLTDKSKGCKISSAEIKNNSGNGIAMNKGSVLTMTGGTVSSNKKNGISVTASNLTAKKITVNNNKENGIGFSSSSKGTVNSSKITKNKKSGITANSGNLNISSNTIENNKKYGISLAGSAKASSLTKNTLSNEGKNELVVSGGAKAPVKTTVSTKLNAVTSNMKQVTGSAHPKSKLTVKAGSKKIGTGVAQNSGSYVIKIKKQKKGTTIGVYSTDAKKNIYQRTVKVGK